MSSEYYSLCIPGSGFSTSLPSLELILCIILIAAVFGFCLAQGGLTWALSKARAGVQSRSAIPGPFGLPIIGLVFAFAGSLTHRVLTNLAKTFEAVPLMAFSIGFTRFIISSHPDIAKDILSSSAFVDRPVKESAYELLFHRAMGFRSIRGIEMVNQVKGLMEKNGVVEIKRVLHFGFLNNVMMSVFGRSYDFNGCDGSELEGLVSEGYELLGIFNWSDHFPLLGLLDLQGVRKRCRELVSRVNVFVGKIIEEHRFKRAKNGGVVGGGDDDDFVDVLLDLENDNKLSDFDMIAVLWLHFETLEPKAISQFSDQVLAIAISIDKLAKTLSGLYNNAPNSRNETSNVEEDLSEPEESEVEEGSVPGKVFNSAELHSYISPKPNRIDGKKNFLGLEAINPSIRLGCVGMASNTDRFMTYKMYGEGASQDHLKLPVKTSLWTQPSDVNILWNHYKCKDYTCLVSNETIDRRGFYKCYDCFDLLRRGWEVPTNESLSAEFTTDEVLSLKPGEIRVGMDFSPTTGTLAAIMREKNVTVASATLNLGASFNELIH
ncbi:hypothetical protein ACSBR2_010259 [Camellia fascicularis]